MLPVRILHRHESMIPQQLYANDNLSKYMHFISAKSTTNDVPWWQLSEQKMRTAVPEPDPIRTTPGCTPAPYWLHHQTNLLWTPSQLWCTSVKINQEIHIISALILGTYWVNSKLKWVPDWDNVLTIGANIPLDLVLAFKCAATKQNNGCRRCDKFAAKSLKK